MEKILNKKAVSAIECIENTNFTQRTKQLESIGEWGFAILLCWNQIEMALKVIRYGDSIKDGWPDKLNSRWRMIQHLETNYPEKYNIMLSGSSDSLWKIINGIAHEGCNFPADSYSKHVEAALLIMAELQKNIPSLEQTKKKKRRSDAQHAVKV